MDSIIGILVTSFIVGLSGAMMPGPVLTITIGEASRRGFIAGPLVVLGHGILEFVLVISISLGLGKILAMNTVVGVIALLGGFLLLWMGIGMLKSVRRLSLSIDVSDNQNYKNHPVIAGILTSISNPYWTVWWATIGLGYIALSQKLGLMGWLSFYFGHIMSDLIWYSAVSFTVGMGRRLMTDKIYRGIIACCAIFLLVFGLMFGYSGIKHLI